LDKKGKNRQEILRFYENEMEASQSGGEKKEFEFENMNKFN